MTATDRELIQRLVDYVDVMPLEGALALAEEARAYLDQPEPEGPTDEALENLADVMNVPGDPVPAMRRALDLWGHQRPTPIPLAQRQPTKADCDADGHCWLFHVGLDGVGDWHQRKPYPSASSYQFFMITHWLPHWALPIPTL